MKIKKLFCSILVVTMAFATTNNLKLVKAADNKELKIESVSIKKGTSTYVDVPVTLTGCKNMWSLNFTVTYDNEKLELDSVKNGDIFSEEDVQKPQNFDVDKSVYTFEAVNKGFLGISKDGKVVTLHFKIKDNQTPFEDALKLNLIEILDNTGSDINDVTATGGTFACEALVHSVAIQWGSMDFIYTDETKGTWNPETKKYEGGQKANWKESTTGANVITVENEGDYDEQFTCTYQAETGYAGVNGEFYQDTTKVNSDIIVEKETNKTTNLKLSGEPEKNISNTKIGSVTLTIK